MISRFISSFASTSFTFTSSLSARSFTVMPSASVIVRVTGGGGALIGADEGRDIGSRRVRCTGAAGRNGGRAPAATRPLRVLSGPRRKSGLLRTNRLRRQRPRAARRGARSRRRGTAAGVLVDAAAAIRQGAAHRPSPEQRLPPRPVPDAVAPGRRLVVARAVRLTRGAGCVGSGASGVVGRCCSMRRRSVGGTIRPGTAALTGAGGGAGAGGVGGGGGGATSMAALATGSSAGDSSATISGGVAGSGAIDDRYLLDRRLFDGRWLRFDRRRFFRLRLGRREARASRSSPAGAAAVTARPAWAVRAPSWRARLSFRP